MDLGQLQTFLIVASSGSFSTAAEQLFLTQPAVSKRIAALESELGSPLFDRVGRQVGLTEAGQALLPHARAILLAAEDGRRAIANLTAEVSGRLLLGVSHHIGLHRLPPVLRRYVHRYPAVQLDLRFMESEDACQALERGELELALITLPPEPREALELVAVWQDSLVVVTAPDHPLTIHPPQQLADLAPWPAILPDTTTYTRGVIEAAFRAAGLPLEVAQTTNLLETIRMLVAVGLGWSLLPESMATDGVRSHPIPSLQLTRRLGVARHVRRVLSSAARALWAELDPDTVPHSQPPGR